MNVSFGSKVRHRICGCVAMGSAVLFILRSRLLLYSAGSGVNRVQVVLSGFRVTLFCFVMTGTNTHKTQKTPSLHYNHRQTYMTQTRHSPTYFTKQARNAYQ